MRVHNVIIITSGMGMKPALDSLDQLITETVATKKKPILVLGPDGDDFLARTSHVEDCELVFDPNFRGGFFSSLKAGLHATHGAAMIVPINEAQPDTIQRLMNLELQISGDGTELDCDLVYPSYGSDFFLVTAKGVNRLRQIPANERWPNPDLKTMVGVEVHRPDPAT